MDENEFFRNASLRVCGQLDIAEAIGPGGSSFLRPAARSILHEHRATGTHCVGQNFRVPAS